MVIRLQIYLYSLCKLNFLVSLEMIHIDCLICSSTNLTAPDPPPGMVMKYIDWRHVLFPYTQMWNNALEVMYYFAEHNPDGFIDGPFSMTSPRFRTEIMFDTQPWPGKLSYSYAAQALYKMGTRMALEKAYFLQWGKIYIDGSQYGILKFQQISAGNQKNKLISGSEPLTSNNSTVNGTLEMVVPYDAAVIESNYSAITDPRDFGKIYDFQDKNLVISFEFTGNPIKGSEVFMCFLDGLATAADHDSREVTASINSYSGTFDTWLHVLHLDSPRYYQRGLNWGTLARVLIIVWEQLIMGNSPGRRGQPPRYEGLEFEIFYYGEKIGAGELWSVGPKVGTSVSR